MSTRAADAVSTGQVLHRRPTSFVRRPAEKIPVVIGGVMATSTVVGRFRWCCLVWNSPPNPGEADAAA